MSVFAVSLCPTPGLPVSLIKQFVHTSGTLAFVAVTQKIHPWESDVQWGCVNRFNWKVANKSMVLILINWLASRAQYKGSRQKCLLIFPVKEVYLHILKCCFLGVWLPISPHLVLTEIPLRFPHWHLRWQVLALPQILGVTKNRDGYLDNHRWLKDNQELGQSWMISFISYTRSCLQDWELALLSNTQKPMQKVKKNEKHKNMF